MPTPTLASIADLKARLGIGSGPGNNARAEARLADVLAMATADVESFCRRTFAYGPRRQRFRLLPTTTSRTDWAGYSEDGIAYRTGWQTLQLEGIPVDLGQPFKIQQSYQGLPADN